MSSYQFIDGGYVRGLIDRFSEAYFGGLTPGINKVGLIETGQRNFYYDCPPTRKSGESEADYSKRLDRYNMFIDTLRNTAGWHVFEGVIKGRPKRQKGIDVKITVDMLMHTLQGNMASATLFAGDQDFVPLVQMLVQQGMRVLVRSGPRASRELVEAADQSDRFTAQRIMGFVNHPKRFDTHKEVEVKDSDYRVLKSGRLMKSGQRIEIRDYGESVDVIVEGNQTRQFATINAKAAEWIAFGFGPARWQNDA